MSSNFSCMPLGLLTFPLVDTALAVSSSPPLCFELHGPDRRTPILAPSSTSPLVIAADRKNPRSSSTPPSSPPFPLPPALDQARRATISALFPEHVNADYWPYAQWRCTQRVFSSMLHVLSTQSLLIAVGVGQRTALPAAAALNWVLKEGIGKIGKLVVAASAGRSFDSDLKRYRFTASLLYNSATGLELLTPLFPHLFLPLASLATCGKTVGLSFALAVQPAIHKSFLSGADNMAEITAKSQAQHVLADNTGLALAILLAKGLERLPMVAALPPRQRCLAPLLAYPFLAVIDLFCTYKEMKAVLLRNLNRPRAEIIAEHWLDKGSLPTRQQVSDRECLLLPSSLALNVQDPPFSFVSIRNLATTGDELRDVLRSSRRRRYAIRVVHEDQGKRHPTIRVALREDASMHDVLASVMHAALLRRERDGKQSHRDAESWASLVALTETRAQREARRLLSALKRDEWDVSRFLFSSNERIRYALP